MVQLREVPQTVMNLGLGAVFGVVILLILANLQTSSSVAINSSAYNAAGNAITGVGNVFAQYGLVGTIIGFAIIIGIIAALYFAFVPHREV